jgi:hypothetical protein
MLQAEDQQLTKRQPVVDTDVKGATAGDLG